MSGKNPYQSPVEPSERGSVFSRFDFAIRRGIKGFRLEMLRSNVPPEEQVPSLLFVVVLLLFVLLVLVAIVMGAGSEVFGFFRSRM